ncbi:MAG: DUF4145 domain-containing protein [Acidobacteriia bacterium]|nr:DUF4145 domain-containing protein [Terriglobia bacterium]
MSDLPLSQYLLSDIEVMDREYDRHVPAGEREEHEKTKRIIEALTKHLVDSRETFLEKPITVLDQLSHSHREVVEHLIDDYYTRQQLENMSSFVYRTLSLSQLETAHIPSQQTRTYVREATRTYIYGLNQATVALCRAAVEQCLKEKLGRQGDGRYLEFRELVKESRKWNVLDDTTEPLAREIARAGDSVLHEKPIAESQALEILIKTRGLLQQISAAKAGY